jgi:Protein of unknown function (DUF4238)
MRCSQNLACREHEHANMKTRLKKRGAACCRNPHICKKPQDTIDLDLLKFKRPVFAEQKTTAEVCRSKDFYTIKEKHGEQFKHLEGLDPLYLEKKFHEYEREYPKLLKKIKAKISYLSRTEAELFLYALIDIKIRNLYFRDKSITPKTETVIDNLFNQYRDELNALNLTEKQQKTKKVMFDEMDKMKEKIMMDKDFGQKVHLSSLTLRKMEAESIHHKIIAHLMKFDWIILESANQFITTDNPGVSIDPTNKPQNTKFEGSLFFFMPITPSLCFGVCTQTPDPNYSRYNIFKDIIYAPAPPQMIEIINEIHGYHVTKYIFSNNKQVINSIAEKINKVHGL